MKISEIAALAGVSTAAVSRYLNGGSVSEDKKGDRENGLHSQHRRKIAKTTENKRNRRYRTEGQFRLGEQSYRGYFLGAEQVGLPDYFRQRRKRRGT